MLSTSEQEKLESLTAGFAQLNEQNRHHILAIAQALLFAQEIGRSVNTKPDIPPIGNI